MAASPIALTVGDIELTAGRTREVDWGLEGLEGWYESADISVSGDRRSNAPGVFFQQGRAGGKMITVNGFVRSRDRVFLTDAMDTISATLADGSLGTMNVYDEDSGWRWAPVQRTGAPQFTLLTRRIVKFQLQFLAPDPYRYGQTSTSTTGFAAASGSGMIFDLFPDGVMDFGPLPSSGATTVQNPGTAPASPVFTVRGPSPVNGFTITDVSTGRRNSFLGPVPEGSTLTLDGSDGSVLLDGVADRLGDALIQAWPTVAPQSTAKFLFEPLGAATAAELTTAVTATYW